MKITRNQLRGLIREEISRVLEISSKSVADTGMGASSSSSGGSSSVSGTKDKKTKRSRDKDAPDLVKLRDKISTALAGVYGSTLTPEDLPDESVKSGELTTIKFTLPSGNLTQVRSKLDDAKNTLIGQGLSAGMKLEATPSTSGSGEAITISVEVTVPRTF
jgi:hypothetical protein